MSYNVQKMFCFKLLVVYHVSHKKAGKLTSTDTSQPDKNIERWMMKGSKYNDNVIKDAKGMNVCLK